MTPWELAAKSEHSQQRALFAWANCVAEYGFKFAAMPDYYSRDGRAALAAVSGLVKVPGVPELSLLFAIHNAGHGDAIRGAQAKAEGVKAGVPDIMLPVPRVVGVYTAYGLFIELKKVKKGVVSVVQSNWGAQLQQQGYAFRLCKGWIEAANDIAYYMGSPVRVE